MIYFIKIIFLIFFSRCLSVVFSSITFLTLFLPVVLILYFIIKDIRWKNGVLLIASLLFYSWGEPIWILAMIASTLINYICAAIMDRCKTKSLRIFSLTVGVIASVAALFYFKYAAFLFNSFSGLFGASVTMPVLKLPVGISFYTFQVLTYTVDVYRKKSPVQKSFFKLLLYISCFPQLIAGPIVQYSDVASMLDQRSTTVDNFVAGAKRFVVGLAKKVLIANVCGSIIEQLPKVTETASVSTLCAWYIAALYSLQLYFDFSGYSDMAIGLGEIFGFTYKENFNYPYISRSATEFWRRWHISLGSFFRDYIYIPLGGNRRGVFRTIFNLLVVWMLTGLWHGASWNFVLWGLYYGVILIIERFIIGERLKKIPAIISIPCTLVVIMVGWVIFYYTDLSLVINHIKAMFGISSSGLIDAVTIAVIRKYTFLPLIGVLAALPIIPLIKSKIKPDDALSTAVEVSTTVILTALLIISLIFIIGQSYNPFIYFRF